MAERDDSLFGKLSDALEKVASVLAMISVGVMSLDLVVAVFFRYVLSAPLVWADEVALFLLAWVTFLGACISLKRNDMVAVTLLVERFRGIPLRVVQIVIQLLMLSFSSLMLYYGYLWVTSSSTINARSAALQVPMWMPYVILPFGMLLLVVFGLDNIRKILRGRF